MSIFSSVKNLFSSSKTIDDVFDKDNGHLAKVGAWIGNMKYTDEEQAKMTHKFVVDTLDENTDRSRTRRDISTLVIRLWVVLVACSGAVYPFNPDWSQQLFNLSMSSTMLSLVGGIGLFFFGTHMLRSSKFKGE